ncbi:MAG TPA: sialate O-acetylesterase [Pirellulaceae bacterium]|nr:sialate O-acetylesterase [Pirellulaceae bacterium]
MRACLIGSILCCLGLTTLPPQPLAAETRLPKVLTDHMVVQRQKPIRIWGWDDPGQVVQVSLGDETVTGTADDQGRWAVDLAAREAGGPFEIKVAGSSERTLGDILIGEVWICSGQSNMEWPVAASDNPEQEIREANHPRIRHLKIPHIPATSPQDDVATDGWQVCSPETVPGFTAVGYFFARELERELDVPIGLVGSNWGGTRIEPWTPPQGFRSVEALKEISDALDTFPTVNADGGINFQTPLALYNGMIAPLVPMRVRGAIWYQGESNNGEGMLYHEKMKALIGGWRDLWQDPEMPFYFVQLAPFRYGGDPTALAGIWEAQLESLAIPHTGMAVTTDITQLDDIHPRNKQDVGRRLSLWALAGPYGREGIVVSGPLYREMKVEGSKIRLHFDHVGSGLVSLDEQPLNSFTIAGKDGNYVEAQATIDGDSIVVSAESVSEPVAVRFGWHQEATPNLGNVERLPASPFRTSRD